MYVNLMPPHPQNQIVNVSCNIQNLVFNVQRLVRQKQGSTFQMSQKLLLTHIKVILHHGQQLRVQVTSHSHTFTESALKTNRKVVWYLIKQWLNILMEYFSKDNQSHFSYKLATKTQTTYAKKGLQVTFR